MSVAHRLAPAHARMLLRPRLLSGTGRDSRAQMAARARVRVGSLAHAEPRARAADRGRARRLHARRETHVAARTAQKCMTHEMGKR
eukprot:1906302-Pleurochrysis_carterae.AAC.1